MFLRGVSTRKVGAIVQVLTGSEVSAQTVSRITRSLDAEVQEFRRRPLQDRYRYLLLDGIVLKVKGASKVQRRGPWTC
jgi:transposase-like protein